MDIDKFIPEINPNWVVRKEILYYKKGALIPMLRKIDGYFYISLDRRATRQVIKLIKRLSQLEINFFLCDRMTISEKHIYSEDLERIVRNYLLALSDEVFFKFTQNSDFDYIQNLTNFLNLYGCHKTFKKVYEKHKTNHFLKLWTDWYTRRNYHNVKNEQIRDFYSILERQVKLNIFFS